MNKFSLKGHVILITGASSGIGRSCAVEASKLGATCILTGRNEEELIKTQKMCKLPTLIYAGDMVNQEFIKNLVSNLSNIDGVVHCAGITNPWPIKFLKNEHIKEMFDINFFSPVLLTTELFQKNKINIGASFVFISSISSQHPYFGGSTYASSKAAIEAFSKSLAIEMASKKIRSNVVRPGLVKTRMFDEAKGASVDSENFDQYEKFYPLGFGEPEDVSNAVCFLLSKESKWITGIDLKMDGGLVLNSKKN